MGPMACPEMSVRRHKSTLRDIPEEWGYYYFAVGAQIHEIYFVLRGIVKKRRTVVLHMAEGLFKNYILKAQWSIYVPPV